MDFLGPYDAIVTYIMIGFAVLYVVIEILLNINDATGDTSNFILFKASQKRLFFIPFALGAILGHLFLGTQDINYRFSNSMIPVFILFGFAVLNLLITWKFPLKSEVPIWILSILLALGIVFGHLFWSMNYLETS